MDNLISVIVPAYNVAEQIGRCLDSIVNQSYENIEIIVVDDGSSDDTGKILDEYMKNHPEKVKVIHIPNGGVTNARLTGVAQAQGEWIGFVDGDDIIEPNMYELLISNAIYYGADISHCGYQMVFEDGRVNYFHNTGKVEEQERVKGVEDLLEGTLVEPGLCNKLFKKKLFHKLLDDDVMDKSIKINEDLLMNFFLFNDASKSIFEDICPYRYIVRQGSATRRKLSINKIYDPIKVKKYILNSVTEELRDVAKKAYLSTCINVYNGIILDPNKEFEKDLYYIRDVIIEHCKWINNLSKKQRILAWIIQYIPVMYKPLYKVYAKFFLKNLYE